MWESKDGGSHAERGETFLSSRGQRERRQLTCMSSASMHEHRLSSLFSSSPSLNSLIFFFYFPAHPMFSNFFCRIILTITEAWPCLRRLSQRHHSRLTGNKPIHLPMQRPQSSSGWRRYCFWIEPCIDLFTNVGRPLIQHLARKKYF